MSRIGELEARRRRLLAKCELQRVELAERVDELKQTPLSRAASELLARPGSGRGLPLGKPVALAAALAGLLLLRRPAQVLTLLGWARSALMFGSRAAFVLRMVEQLRTRRGSGERAGP